MRPLLLRTLQQPFAPYVLATQPVQPTGPHAVRSSSNCDPGGRPTTRTTARTAASRYLIQSPITGRPNPGSIPSLPYQTSTVVKVRPHVKPPAAAVSQPCPASACWTPLFTVNKRISYPLALAMLVVEASFGIQLHRLHIDNNWVPPHTHRWRPPCTSTSPSTDT